MAETAVASGADFASSLNGAPLDVEMKDEAAQEVHPTYIQSAVLY